MANFLDPWRRLADQNTVAGLIDTHLRGAGQVMLQDNPLTGFLFIVGITWGAIAAGNLAVVAGALVALIVSTMTAVLLKAEKTSLRQGMYGFNGILVGVAVPSLLAANTSMWVLLVLGAGVSTVVMLAVGNIMKMWGAPALTFPFVVTTWFLALAAYAFGHVEIVSMAPPAFPVEPTAGNADISPGFLITSWLKGPAQVFLIGNVVTGAIFIVALLVNSVWAAVFALTGSAVSVVFALLLGASTSDIHSGLYSFSAVLTAIALGSVFYKPSWRVTLFALLGTVFTVVVQGALDAAVAPAGIPTFTAPFVFVTWLFLLPRVNLPPHPHSPIENGILTGK
ncbi:MAG: urea transporter [Gemmatimonas sp.]|nr:urea transporter [Gemmatimonas sp.]